MINISRLLFGMRSYGDLLRYNEHKTSRENNSSSRYGPVVVWNITRACNLMCRHCYAGSNSMVDPEELSTQEAKIIIKNMAEFGVPVIIFSGGEPFTRSDLDELIAYAGNCGIRVTLSTNGTLIDRTVAKKVKDLGVSYVGISLDGIGENHDRLRGKKGAFSDAMDGIRNCREAGVKVGLRFTIGKYNYQELHPIFDLISVENISRVCFYHLVYSGRGTAMIDEDLNHQETREVFDLIIKRTEQLFGQGKKVEVLTVDNHCDAIYLYLKLLREKSPNASEVYHLLETNGGNRSGVGIVAVDWKGNVLPDQFSRGYALGNVREKKFGEICTDLNNTFLTKLKSRSGEVGGRCLQCRWFKICNGNLRARAAAVYNDYWAEDPACYLTDDEIKASGGESV